MGVQHLSLQALWGFLLGREPYHTRATQQRAELPERGIPTNG